MPLDIDVVEPIPEKKPSRWKRFFGIGKKKNKPPVVVIKPGTGKLAKKKKSIVDWD